MTETKPSENKQRSKLLKILLVAFLSIALMFAGVITLNSHTKMMDVRFSVMSTEDGTYHNATQGGRLSVNNARVGASLTQTVREGQAITLKAEANEGYSFAGYFTSLDNKTPLSTDAEYAFVPTTNTAQIYASFAKNYDITFTVGDPFNDGSSISFTETFYVGQKVTISDVIANSSSLGEGYAAYFENSTAELGQEENVGGFSFSKNQITVGAGSTSLTIQPSEPTNVGWAGGTGTSSDPYQIATAAQLNQLSTDVKAGTNYSGKYFKVTAPITVSAFVPIGGYDTSTSTAYSFNGTFDGGSKTITISSIGTTSANYVGLFGYNAGTVKNITVAGTVTGASYVGGVVGYNAGTVSSAYSTATVNGSGSYVGGVVGVNNGALTNARHYTGAVNGTNATFGLAIGGVVGINLSAGTVYNAYNTATVQANNYQWVGGVAGQNHGIIYNSYNQGATTGSYYVGGVIGQNGGGTLITAYNSGTITATNTYAGGVVGYNNEGTIKYTYYATGEAKSGGTSGTAQYGIGSGTSGDTTDDVTDITTGFTKSSGTLAKSVTINGETTSALNRAMNLSWMYVDALFSLSGNYGTSSRFFAWTTATLPVWGSNYYLMAWSTNAAGTADSTSWGIDTRDRLNYLALMVNAGHTYSGRFFKLTATIDLGGSSKPWIPIGTYDDVYSVERPFSGTLNGQGKTISSLYISSSKNYIGLFGYNTGKIYNINFLQLKYWGG